MCTEVNILEMQLNANSIIIILITTRLKIGYTGRQTMGTESRQEPSGVLLSNYAKEQHFVSILAVEVHISEMNQIQNFF
jgi:hypothetical protein